MGTHSAATLLELADAQTGQKGGLPMSKDKEMIDELAGLLEKATEGPWRAENSNGGYQVWGPISDTTVFRLALLGYAKNYDKNNSAAIAALRNAAPRLIELARREMEAEQEPDDLWLLQDSRSYVGNDLLFWAEDGGYTTDVSKAKRWTKDHAYSQNKCRDTDRPWPLAYILKKTRPAVDHQYVDYAEAVPPRAEGDKP